MMVSRELPTHCTIETVQRVRDFILANPEIRDDTSAFIEGWGWDHTKWDPEEWPTAVCAFLMDPRSSNN